MTETVTIATFRTPQGNEAVAVLNGDPANPAIYTGHIEQLPTSTSKLSKPYAWLTEVYGLGESCYELFMPLDEARERMMNDAEKVAGRYTTPDNIERSVLNH